MILANALTAEHSMIASRVVHRASLAVWETLAPTGQNWNRQNERS